ncbi:phosphoglycerate kinase [Candidatus Nanosyncoccus alces]|uniref:Phosphoglycerate kinase n=1 Tax=Candidatus Nanosyncoccus alces TaxID=2171997 RepID=A0ABY0FMQ0_9BACT|nr:phosphoglycerate kinase [Candidatus Nanosyncoccus alces]RYC75105.1 Phosphoglycerate kinase [Candidatus Nanosyncoccus alces]
MYQTIRDVDVKGKTILVRVDYNVPLDGDKITDDLRVRASLPTLEYLRAAGAEKIIVISHLGRPEGKDESLSLGIVAKALGKMLPDVAFVSEVDGKEVKEAVARLKNGGILMLENLRFYSGEKANSSDFIQSIIETTGAEIYVQDGFAVVHRAHASTDAVAKFLPVYMGLLLEKEITNLEKVANDPEKPVLLIIGGSKVEDKKPLIEKFMRSADRIVVGGKIAADGYEGKGNIYVAEDFDEDSAGAKLDVGPLSMAKIAGFITDAKTIIWNGLLGKAEDPAYATASTITAEMIGEKEDAETVICGGDTTGFVENLMKDHSNLKYSLVSTGGGAALELLAGKRLPGLEVIKKN